MLKQPLFGQDSSPHRTSFFISLLSTFVFWVLFTVMAIFVKIDAPSPQFKTVQIVLDSPLPLEQTEEAESEFTNETENAVAESEAVAEEIVAEASPVIEESLPVVETVEPVVDIPEPKVEPTPIVEAPKPLVEKPAPVIEKPAPAKKEPVKEVPKVEKTETKPVETTPAVTDESKKVDYALQKSVDDLWKQQVDNTKPKANVEWDDSLFDDDSSSTEKTTSSDSKKVTTSSSTAGSAANTASQESARQTSNSDSAKKSSTSASQSTSSDLDKIAKAESKSGSGTKTDISVKTSKDGSGKVMMEMADGSKRALIIPEKPELYLSEKAARSLPVLEVTYIIEFKVVQKGNVPRTEIKITPEAQLTESIRAEIIDQLSKWVFEEAEFDGTAKFKYTIKQRG